MNKNIALDRKFFNRNPDLVAQELLGKTLVRRINGEMLKARIVETEAYFDSSDPASRARQNGDLRKTMAMAPGTILVYGVHNNWLLNFVTGPENFASAVLIRAIEPLNFKDRCNGPGLLTKSLKIDKNLHKKSILENPEIILYDLPYGEVEIVKSFRVGVVKDLKQPLRFYLKDNKHVSKL